MEAVVERATMWEAYRRVIRNGGAAGVDGMTCADLKDHLKAHWAVIRKKLLSGEYLPMAVRKVEIPKPQGGKRGLGIPTVQDRLIQQALVQVLQRVFEPGFSEHSYGFRPGRSAHQAVRQAQGYVREGRRRVARSRHCCPTFCSPIWTGSWSGVVMRLSVMPTTATSTCRPGAAVSV